MDAQVQELHAHRVCSGPGWHLAAAGQASPLKAMPGLVSAARSMAEAEPPQDVASPLTSSFPPMWPGWATPVAQVSLKIRFVSFESKLLEPISQQGYE